MLDQRSSGGRTDARPPEAMIEGERNLDPDGNGVAVVIEVDSVAGFGADGVFQQARA